SVERASGQSTKVIRNIFSNSNAAFGLQFQMKSVCGISCLYLLPKSKYPYSFRNNFSSPGLDRINIHREYGEKAYQVFCFLCYSPDQRRAEPDSGTGYPFAG